MVENNNTMIMKMSENSQLSKVEKLNKRPDNHLPSMTLQQKQFLFTRNVDLIWLIIIWHQQMLITQRFFELVIKDIVFITWATWKCWYLFYWRCLTYSVNSHIWCKMFPCIHCLIMLDPWTQENSLLQTLLSAAAVKRLLMWLLTGCEIGKWKFECYMFLWCMKLA